MRILFKIGLFFGFFIVFTLCLLRIFFWIDKQNEENLAQKQRHIQRIPPKELALLQNGDIILRRGYGFFSDFIAQNLNTKFDLTHAGILHKKGEKWHVIHSLSSEASHADGMQEQSLSEFLRYCVPHKILIVRLKNASLADGEKIVERAQYYLQQKIPFDRLGMIDEASELYCTELIWQIVGNDLNLVQLPQNPKERKDLFYSMKGMYAPEYFDIIVNLYKNESPDSH